MTKLNDFIFLVGAVVGCTNSTNANQDAASKQDDGGTVDASAGDGSLPVSNGVTVIVKPNGHGNSEIVNAINAATSSVYMTMYQIDDSDVLDALAARARAGVDVEAILDGSVTGFDNKSSNTPAYNQLSAAGVSVAWSNPSFTYTHEKCLIVDGAQAWIMTMNLNVSSPNDDREYLALDTDSSDVAEATAVFKADHALQAITPAGVLVVANANARAKLVQLIDTATSTLDVEGEEFSDNNQNGIVDAVASAARRGVAVRVVIANTSKTSAETTAINTAKAAGAKVVITGPTSSSGTSTNPYIAGKAVVVDCAGTTCARGFVGSENFTAGSLGYNRELGVLIDDATELAKIEAAINLDFGHGTAQ